MKLQWLILMVWAAMASNCGISSTALGQGDSFSEPIWTKAEVDRILMRAEADPSALWELKDAPIDLTYRELQILWGRGEASIERREMARKRGKEKEWLDLEKKVNRDPDVDARFFPVARDVLLSHPNLEPYISKKMEYFKDVLLRARTDPESRNKSEYSEVLGEYKGYIFFATRLPTDMGFRIAGSFLSSPYFPEQDHGDFIEPSPAACALGSLSDLAKKRLGEEIPKDIEAARKWWRENEHRFAIKPPPAPAPELPAPDSPAASDPPVPPIIQALPVAESPPAPASRSRWLPATAIAAVLLVATLAFRSWRKRKNF